MTSTTKLDAFARQERAVINAANLLNELEQAGVLNWLRDDGEDTHELADEIEAAIKERKDADQVALAAINEAAKRTAKPGGCPHLNVHLRPERFDHGVTVCLACKRMVEVATFGYANGKDADKQFEDALKKCDDMKASGKLVESWKDNL